MTNPYHMAGKPPRKSWVDCLFTLNLSPMASGFILGVVGALLILILCFCIGGCQTALPIIPPAPPPPVSVAPAIGANATALDTAGTAVAGIPAQAEAAAVAAPVVRPQAEAIKTAAATAAGAVATAKTNSATVAAGVDERDRALAALKKIVDAQAAAMKKETDRADGAEKALADRARNRIEWMLSIGGFSTAALAILGAYLLFQAGSLVRAAGVLAAGLTLSAACFAAAVYFDLILRIGAVALGAAALIGLVAAVLHYRKHLGHAEAEVLDEIEAHGATQARLTSLHLATATV